MHAQLSTERSGAASEFPSDEGVSENNRTASGKGGLLRARSDRGQQDAGVALPRRGAGVMDRILWTQVPATVPLILITNDDGIDSPGIRALERSLAPLGRIRTAAPLTEQSAASRRITLRRPLRYERKGNQRFGIDGAPCDCVMMAITLLLEERPALVVSGINNGPNLGENIYYSGTVAAAAEAAKYGIPAMAVSVDQRVDIDFEPVARIAAELASRVLADGLPPGIVLNVNLPAGAVAGVAVTHQCRKISRNLMVETRDPWDRPYYWMHEEVPLEAAEDGSDYAAIRDGYLSITPLHFDHTAHAEIEGLRRDFSEFDPNGC